jgi:hypothetical protein
LLDVNTLKFLAAPFVASLILSGIHAYLGVHVVERGVIFVDLSLAQIAALGATIALLLPISGGDPHGPMVYWISLAFTFIGAFSSRDPPTRTHPARKPSSGFVSGGVGAAILAMAPEADAGRQHSGCVPVRSARPLHCTAGRVIPLHLPPQVFNYLDRSRARSERGSRSVSGTSCLCPRLASP